MVSFRDHFIFSCFYLSTSGVRPFCCTSGCCLLEISLRRGDVADLGSVKNHLITSSGSACWRILSRTLSQKLVSLKHQITTVTLVQELQLNLNLFRAPPVFSAGSEVSSWSTGGGVCGPAEVHLTSAGWGGQKVQPLQI